MKKSKIYPSNYFYNLPQIVKQGLKPLIRNRGFKCFHKMRNDDMYNIGYTINKDSFIGQIHKTLLPYFRYQVTLITYTVSYDFDTLKYLNKAVTQHSLISSVKD